MAKGNKRTIYLGLDYTDFTGGVTEVNRKMGLLDAEFKLAQEQAKNYGTEADKLGIKQDYLGQKIALQTKKVEAAKKAYKEATTSQKASEKQLDALAKKCLQEQTALEKLTGELEEYKTETEKTSGETKSFGDVIRELASEIGLDAIPAVEKLASKFDNTSKEMGELIVVTGTVISSLAACSVESAEYAEEMLKLSSVTGLSTDELQKFEYAATHLDVSMDSLSDALKEITNKMYDAKTGGTETQETFRKLGISITDGKGQMRDANEVFYEVVDALGRINNETERDAVAMELLGESARNMNPLIEAGSEKLRQLGIDAEKMGVVISETSLGEMKRFGDSMEEWNDRVLKVKVSLSEILLPVLNGFMDMITSIPTPVLTAATTFLVLVVVFGSIAKAAQTVATANALLAASNTLVGVTGTTATAGMAPLLLILLAVAAAIALITGAVSGIKKAMNEAKESAQQVADSTKQLTGSIQNTTTYGQNASRNLNFKLREHKEGVYSTSLNASGTENFRGGRTWVGEAGPEIVELPPGTRIHSNEDSMGRTVNYYNITLTLREMKEFIEMKEYFDRRQLEERRA